MSQPPPEAPPVPQAPLFGPCWPLPRGAGDRDKPKCGAIVGGTRGASNPGPHFLPQLPRPDKSLGLEAAPKPSKDKGPGSGESSEDKRERRCSPPHPCRPLLTHQPRSRSHRAASPHFPPSWALAPPSPGSPAPRPAPGSPRGLASSGLLIRGRNTITVPRSPPGVLAAGGNQGAVRPP